MAFVHKPPARKDRRGPVKGRSGIRRVSHALVDDFPIGVYRTTPDGTISYANRTIVAMLGFGSFRELAKRNLEVEGFPAGFDRRVFRELVDRQGDVQGFESVWVAKDGTLVPVRENVRAVRGTSGRVVSYVGTAERISEGVLPENERSAVDEYAHRIMQSLHEIVFQADVHGVLRFLNQAWPQATGYTVQEGLGRTFLEFIHPDDHETTLGHHRNLLAGTEEACHFEVRYRMQDGTIRWMEVHMRALRDRDGSIIGSSGTLTDISGRRQAEEALRESEERYRKLVEMSPDAILVHDRGRVQYANPAGLKLIGATSPEQVYSLPLLHFVHPDSQEVVKRRIGAMSAQGASVPLIEERFVKMDGTPVDVEVTATPFNHAGRQLIQVIVRDIGERKKVEAILRQREELLEMMFQRNTAVMLLINPADGTITDANPAASEFYGWPLATLKSMKISDINTLPDVAVREVLLKAEEGSVNTFFFRHRLADGRVRDVEVHSSPLALHNTTLLLSIVHDITERIQAEQELQASLKEKDVLLKEVYHRVKNNLTVVAGLLSLQSRFVRSREDAMMFEETKSRIQAMGRVHQQLYQSEQLSSIDFNEYLHDLTGSLAATYGTPGIETLVESDHLRLGLDQAIPCGLIVNELLSNCYKYAFVGRGAGRVVVGCHRTGNDSIILSVSDDGVGLPESVDMTGLTSLGLSLVSMLADQLGATLSIDRGTGTTFKVEIPIPKGA
jgi:PAS domain S-box-containing protein